MKTGPPIAIVASLIGDPARANILTALMGGKALTASELAVAAGVTAPTTSGHLAKLLDGGLVLCVQQGRHRYFRLAAPEIADLLESLMGFAVRSGRSLRSTGPADTALRHARVCYDHLAGAAGVRLADGLCRKGIIASDGRSFSVTPTGQGFLCDFGLDMEAIGSQRRPVCRACLDWSERRPHLGGALGAALFRRFQDMGWLRRMPGTRAVQITPAGELGLRRLLDESSEQLQVKAVG